MDVDKVTFGAVVVSIAVLFASLGIVAYSTTFEGEISVPESGASAEGEWQQTACRGLFNGIKNNDIHESNALSITDSGDGHFFYCTHRGVDCLGIRYGDYIIWNSVSDSGQSSVICNTYGNCLVVNEIYNGFGISDQTYVNASLYTRDGHIPGWFEYWNSDGAPTKWAIFSANAVDTDDKITALDGRNLYFTTSNGSVFTAELEQYIDSQIVTTDLHGVIVSKSDDGTFSAFAVDSNGYYWFMIYNGNVLCLNAVMDNDNPALTGAIAGVERNYRKYSDTTAPEFLDPVIEKDSRWSLVDSHYFTRDGVADNPVEGEFVVDHARGQLFSTKGLTVSGISVTVLGYTTPGLLPGTYYMGVGLATGLFEGLGMGYGYYDDNTGIMFISVFLMDEYGEVYVAEYQIQNMR